jgi:hypothetical protein
MRGFGNETAREGVETDGEERGCEGLSSSSGTGDGDGGGKVVEVLVVVVVVERQVGEGGLDVKVLESGGD